MSDAASSAATAIQDAPQAARRQTQGNPLAAGLIAFGAGWLVSSLLPASRQEQQLAEQARNKASELGQPLAEAAKQAATEVKDNLQEPARQAVDSVQVHRHRRRTNGGRRGPRCRRGRPGHHPERGRQRPAEQLELRLTGHTPALPSSSTPVRF